MKKIFGIITLVLIIIGLVFGRETQIEWAVYLSIPLAVLFGAAGMAFFQRRIEAIIGGMVIGALLPIILPQFLEAFKLALSALP